MLEIPTYLEDILPRSYDEGMLRTIVIRTPSAQGWNKLSVNQQTKWREIITELGADPEDYLGHMRRMLPKNP